eukprot:3726971-Amphidinium_carterae.1
MPKEKDVQGNIEEWSYYDDVTGEVLPPDLVHKGINKENAEHPEHPRRTWLRKPALRAQLHASPAVAAAAVLPKWKQSQALTPH